MITHVVSKNLPRPQEHIWSTQSVCFCTSSYFMFFVLSRTPPSHRQAGRFFWIFSNTSICILNVSRKWLPSQLLSLCLADKQGKSVYVTQTKYNSLQIPPCSMCARYHSTNACHRIPESVCVVAFFHVDALNVEIYTFDCTSLKIHGETVIGTLTLY